MSKSVNGDRPIRTHISHTPDLSPSSHCDSSHAQWPHSCSINHTASSIAVSSLNKLPIISGITSALPIFSIPVMGALDGRLSALLFLHIPMQKICTTSRKFDVVMLGSHLCHNKDTSLQRQDAQRVWFLCTRLGIISEATRFTNRVWFLCTQLEVTAGAKCSCTVCDSCVHKLIGIIDGASIRAPCVILMYTNLNHRFPFLFSGLLFWSVSGHRKKLWDIRIQWMRILITLRPSQNLLIPLSCLLLLLWNIRQVGLFRSFTRSQPAP